VSDWKVAMLCLLPLMWGQAKLRTWGALFGASLAALFAPFLSAFVVIDLVAAAVILRAPAGFAQRSIGALFVGMILFEIGFLLSEGNQQGLMLSGLQALGWAQWAILATWGAYDAFRYCFRGAGPVGRSLPAGRGAG
jgi:hypothetical protein